MRARGDIDIELPLFILSYNLAVGGVNDDTRGYHHTITHVYIAGVKAHLAEVGHDLPLFKAVNALLLSERGRRDLALRFYSKERLFSVQARREFVAPDRLGLKHI